MEMSEQFAPIRKSEITPSGQDQSAPVSAGQFQKLAQTGSNMLSGMRERGPTPNFDGGMDTAKSHAYAATRSSWGGGTYNPRTGNPVDFHEPDKHAVTVREPGQSPVTVPDHVNADQFGQAMEHAKSKFANQLSTPQHYMGVFRDDDLHEVHMDPVVVTQDRNHDEGQGRFKAQAIAAATHSVGGAYHFASGNGVWPPHVKEG